LRPVRPGAALDAVVVAVDDETPVARGRDEPTGGANPPDERASGRPTTDRPGADRPGTDRPGTDRPGTDRPGTDRPAAAGSADDDTAGGGPDPDDEAAIRRVRELLAAHVPLALIADLTDEVPPAPGELTETEPDAADRPARRTDGTGPR
jgi:hypothetical protein